MWQRLSVAVLRSGTTCLFKLSSGHLEALPALAVGLSKRARKILHRIQHVLGIASPEKTLLAGRIGWDIAARRYSSMRM